MDKLVSNAVRKAIDVIDATDARALRVSDNVKYIGGDGIYMCGSRLALFLKPIGWIRCNWSERRAISRCVARNRKRVMTRMIAAWNRTPVENR